MKDGYKMFEKGLCEEILRSAEWLSLSWTLQEIYRTVRAADFETIRRKIRLLLLSFFKREASHFSACYSISQEMDFAVPGVISVRVKLLSRLFLSRMIKFSDVVIHSHHFFCLNFFW